MTAMLLCLAIIRQHLNSKCFRDSRTEQFGSQTFILHVSIYGYSKQISNYCQFLKQVDICQSQRHAYVKHLYNLDLYNSHSRQL